VAALAALLIIGPAACSSSGGDRRAAKPAEKLPAAAEFRTGTCRSAADAVLALARLAGRREGARTLSRNDRTELSARQKELIKLNATAEADLRQPLTELTVAIGYVRIRSDGNTYEPKLLQSMNTARHGVQTVCVR
jgi:hypothetical protein